MRVLYTSNMAQYHFFEILGRTCFPQSRAPRAVLQVVATQKNCTCGVFTLAYCHHFPHKWASPRASPWDLFLVTKVNQLSFQRSPTKTRTVHSVQVATYTYLPFAFGKTRPFSFSSTSPGGFLRLLSGWLRWVRCRRAAWSDAEDGARRSSMLRECF